MKNKVYKNLLAFEQGKSAFVEGIRRGQNPYSGGDDQNACLAWWDGWDEEERELAERMLQEGD
jgi:hypothetical protein